MHHRGDPASPPGRCDSEQAWAWLKRLPSVTNSACRNTKRQARESRIEIDLGVTGNCFTPHDIDQPVAVPWYAKGNPAPAIGKGRGNRHGVIGQIGELDCGPRQSLTLEKDMHRQPARSVQRVGIAVGNDFELEPDRAGSQALVSRRRRSDLDKGLGAAAVTLAPFLVLQPAPFPNRANQGQPFLRGIIVEAGRRERGVSEVALHAEHMQSTGRKSRDEIGAASAPQRGSQVGAAASEEAPELDDPVIVLPAFAKLAVTNQKVRFDRVRRRQLEPRRLHPEVMRGGRAREQGEDQARGNDTQIHTTSQSIVGRATLVRQRTAVQALGARAASKPGSGSRLALLVAAALVPLPAQAHDGTGVAGGVLAGAYHPLAGLDHLLAMIAVGLWGAFLGRPLLYVLPMLFPGLMVVGAAMGMWEVPLPPVEIGISLSVVMLGGLILLAVRAPIALACLVVGVFALFHGYAHGAELPLAMDPIGYSAGFVLSTGALHLLGIALGTLRTRPGGELALRGAGGAIMAIGGWFLLTAVSA